MVTRRFLLFVICVHFVAYVPLGYNFDTASHSTSFLKTAYGQTPNPGDIGSAATPSDQSNAAASDPTSTSGPNDPSSASTSGPDPSMENNPSNSVSPGDASSGISDNNNTIIQNYTSNAPDSAIVMPNVPGNTTKTVPEFPLAAVVLIVATLSIVLIPKVRSIQKS